MHTGLLIIDIQNDYFPGGSMELVGALEAGNQARRALAVFREKPLPVIHVQHVAVHSGATFFLPDTPGMDIHPFVSPKAGEVIIQKHYPNAFRETPLLEHLRKRSITRLAIVGMMTHMCVDTSVRAAADLGFECLLAYDACATKAQSFGGVTVSAESVQAAFLAAINGTFAKVCSVAEIASAIKPYVQTKACASIA
jgi:nicotinamidase-related amidase